ncbi:transposase [Xanthobacter sp. V2C-8]|uniref:transposase n=1 Tax=Xanthobacter albus TaxID=3119929 RepID=UPI00372C01E0
MRGAPARTDAAKSDAANDRGDPASEEGARASARYAPSVKELAVDEVERRRLRNPRDRTIYREVARQFGVGEQSLRLWVKKKDAARLEAPHSAAAGAAMSPEQMHSELHALRRQIQKLRTENEVLKRAFVVFSSEWGEGEPRAAAPAADGAEPGAETAEPAPDQASSGRSGSFDHSESEPS